MDIWFVTGGCSSHGGYVSRSICSSEYRGSGTDNVASSSIYVRVHGDTWQHDDMFGICASGITDAGGVFVSSTSEGKNRGAAIFIRGVDINISNRDRGNSAAVIGNTASCVSGD